MKTDTRPAARNSLAGSKIPAPAPEWHDFNWTSDGHIPKIDTRTPTDVGWRLLSVRHATRKAE